MQLMVKYQVNTHTQTQLTLQEKIYLETNF